mmetsp:Transcript_81497/g.252991  ORF Transcript_81497/g.252991 Transcript_81497/m.252991 type:complete len:239 (-) Transcript_81497:553-1269(-)
MGRMKGVAWLCSVENETFAGRHWQSIVRKPARDPSSARHHRRLVHGWVPANLSTSVGAHLARHRLPEGLLRETPERGAGGAHGSAHGAVAVGSVRLLHVRRRHHAITASASGRELHALAAASASRREVHALAAASWRELHALALAHRGRGAQHGHRRQADLRLDELHALKAHGRRQSHLVAGRHVRAGRSSRPGRSGHAHAHVRSHLRHAYRRGGPRHVPLVLHAHVRAKLGHPHVVL